MAALTAAKTPKALLDESLAYKGNSIFRAIFREQANIRAGTASTKKRDEVRGGGRKPWRQKGTGRARQGSIRSPQWRHGGVVFGPQPRSFETDLNKKERRLALAAALADRFKNAAVSILDPAALTTDKTADLAILLFGTAKAAKTGPRTLVVFEQHEQNVGARLQRAGANLRKLGITHSGSLDVTDVIGCARLIFTQAAYEKLSAALGGVE
ncbi:MAG TPA: 50S ribosomal protein L4 [Candidatus Baltobacteraceae bacterium]|jgi:large subunit ribosomal protein L4